MPSQSGATRVLSQPPPKPSAAGHVFVKPLAPRNTNKHTSSASKMSHLNDLYGSSKGRRGSRSEVKKAPAKAAAEKKKSVMDEFNVTVKRAPESQVSGETDILASTMKQNSGGMDQHTTMLGILGSRAQALRVVGMLWKEGVDKVIQHLVEQDDQSLAIDVLPTLTLEIKQNGRSHKNSTPTDQRATMPACLEMLPLIKSLVNCAYEDYQIISLQLISAMLYKWIDELRLAASAPLSKKADISISNQGFVSGLIGMRSSVYQLRSGRSNRLTVIAKEVLQMLDSL